ncbi:MAG: Heparinase family protein [Candidatus Solibacter sp.]|nr:Heparinase family protein [Candidatus Solibacter sp.]
MWAQTMSEDDLFSELNLATPGLEKVAAAVRAPSGSDGRATARHLLADYYRHRTRPVYYIAPGEKANPKPLRPDTGAAERALRHEFQSIGYPHTFGPTIDWHFDKTAEPDSKYPPNNEWTWQLNRHAEWSALSRAYRDTGDEKYAREFVAQMTAWARDCLLPKDAANVPRSAWRTIETGIRAAEVWPELWFRFIRAPAMTDDALLTFLRAYIDHAHHLMAFHTTGNWLAMEGNGLYYVGVLFPEFTAAPSWRDTAAKWIYTELNSQVYPDGVQVELSSGYHHVSLSNFLSVYKIARLNERELPADFLKRLEKMYDFDVYGAMPDRRLPGVQDGNYYPVRRALEEAVEYFPERADFRWYATNGHEGKPPAETSHAFRWAGYYVMRSSWDPDARYLWFDGGPFGYGHQHEDKLEIIVEAFGKLLLVDPGNYTYERSKWRNYFIDSPSHNVVLVDGEPQRRRGAPRDQYVVKDPLSAVWKTMPTSDYVEATFDENFGGEVKRNVTHTRAVLFVKPDFWVVLDTLQAKDGKPHTYDALFHFDAKVKAEGVRAVTQNLGEANLTVAARPDPGVTLRIVEGQEDPPQGWLPRGLSAVRPAPVGILTAKGVDAKLLYVLAPAKSGAADPVKSVEAIEGDPRAARIIFNDGRTYEVHFQPGKAEAKRVK